MRLLLSETPCETPVRIGGRETEREDGVEKKKAGGCTLSETPERKDIIVRVRKS